MANDWQPTASRATLQRRAAALAQVRAFFGARGVMEVDTPVVVTAPVSDVHIHSAEVRFPSASSPYFLHTSPEFAMKRLLAAGSGDIYQICHVVRGLEQGRHHNAEFTLIEWYRAGFTLEQLMDEVEALAREVLGPVAASFASERVTYRDAFIRDLRLDPLTCSFEELEHAARGLGFARPSLPEGASSSAPTASRVHRACFADPARDEILDFLMATKIGPALGRNALTFIHRYPASQAALARLDPSDPRCALRFELYCQGIELANGFHELASAAEQRARFEQDNADRKHRALPTHALDERLLAALTSGLPDCSGVALGFDRLLMLTTGATHINEVIPFPTDRA
jgi:elongation factor P--(R)-beta-lysine ligase